jgi:hypothetical protein
LAAKTIKICIDNFNLVLIYSLIFDLPKNLLYNFNRHFYTSPLDVPFGGILLSLFGIVYSAIGFPAFLYAIVYTLKNKKNPPFLEALNWGIGRCLPLLGWLFLYLLRVLLWALAFIIPGIIVSIRYSLLPVVVTFERRGKSSPLIRSKTIAQGHLRALTWINVIFLLIPIALNYLFLIQSGTLSPAPNHFALSVLADFVLDLTSTFYCIMTLLAYLSWTRGKKRTNL